MQNVQGLECVGELSNYNKLTGVVYYYYCWLPAFQPYLVINNLLSTTLISKV